MALIGKKLSRLSYKFLYPFSGALPDGTFDVSGTYCYWTKEENIDNLQLIVHYKHNGNNNLYKTFENNVILKNEQVKKCYKVEDGSVYIYDLILYPDEVFNFINGYYSEFTTKSKTRILRFNEISTSIDVSAENLLHMYLYPEKYYKKLADELDVSVKDLQQAVELGKKFDKKKETLEIGRVEDGKCIEEKIIYY